MKHIQKNAWAAFMGVVLAGAGWYIHTWQFWVVMVPMAFLVAWSKDA